MQCFLCYFSCSLSLHTSCNFDGKNLKTENKNHLKAISMREQLCEGTFKNSSVLVLLVG